MLERTLYLKNRDEVTGFKILKNYSAYLKTQFILHNKHTRLHNKNQSLNFVLESYLHLLWKSQNKKKVWAEWRFLYKIWWYI